MRIGLERSEYQIEFGDLIRYGFTMRVDIIFKQNHEKCFSGAHPTGAHPTGAHPTGATRPSLYLGAISDPPRPTEVRLYKRTYTISC